MQLLHLSSSVNAGRTRLARHLDATVSQCSASKRLSHLAMWVPGSSAESPDYLGFKITGSLVKPNEFGIQIFTGSKLRSHTNYIKHGWDVAWHDGPDRNALRIFSPPESRAMSNLSVKATRLFSRICSSDRLRGKTATRCCDSQRSKTW